MKLFAVIATAIFLVISGVATKTFYDNSQAQKQEKAAEAVRQESYRAAIKTALANRAASEKDCWITGGDPRFDATLFCHKIRLIDVSPCPTEFKTAWFDYLWVWATTPKLSSTEVDNLRYNALRTCQRVAVQYGVWEPAAVPVF